MRRDAARDFRSAKEARVDDRAIPKVNRDGFVLSADPDQLPVDGPILPDRTIDQRLRSIATGKRDDHGPSGIAEGARRVILPKHLIQIGECLPGIPRAAAFVDRNHALSNLWLGGRINGGYEHRGPGFDAAEMNIPLFTQ